MCASVDDFPTPVSPSKHKEKLFKPTIAPSNHAFRPQKHPPLYVPTHLLIFSENDSAHLPRIILVMCELFSTSLLMTPIRSKVDLRSIKPSALVESNGGLTLKNSPLFVGRARD
jgi:hypothetical protein